MIKNALKVLTSDGTFQIDQINYYEKSFGNAIAVLKSNSRVDARFIKDRGDFWCEIGQAGDWYFIEDVFSFVGVTGIAKSGDFVDFITETSTIIKKNLTPIFKAFDAKHSKDTKSKIKEMATKRAMEMFGI